MIVYRYNLGTDPEPGPHVKRLCTHASGWRDEGSIWTRVPCRRRGYRNVGTVMETWDRRRARREGVFCTGRNGRRQHRPATVFYRDSNFSCMGEDHYHWTDGNKFRPWGHFRGAEVAVDLDAFKRLHSMKRRKWRKP